MPRLLQTAYRVVTYYLSYLVFGIGTVFLQVVSLLALPVSRSEFVQRAIRRLIHGLCRLWVGYFRLFRLVDFRFDGFDRLRRKGGLIVAANHPCLMDATYLLAQMPEAVCIYKAAIRRNLFLSAAARAAGYIANDEGLDLVRQASAAAAAGRMLLVFPEGTRTRSGSPVNPLKPGFALIAQRAGVPLQLVFIRTRSNLLRKGCAWWKLPDLPPRFDLVVGPCLEPAPGRVASELAADVEAVFRRELADCVARPDTP